jgi:hypothetical protein
MIPADELAAIAAALGALESRYCNAIPEPEPRMARWKAAARRPDLELEDVRALR